MNTRNQILITGPSGSGKTTLSKLLDGYDLDQVGYRHESDRAHLTWTLPEHLISFWLRNVDHGPKNEFLFGVSTNIRAIIRLPWFAVIIISPAIERVLANRAVRGRDSEWEPVDRIRLTELRRGGDGFDPVFDGGLSRFSGNFHPTHLIRYSASGPDMVASAIRMVATPAGGNRWGRLGVHHTNLP